ncbi:hypothetical protein K461DRAFT_68999 [Myriangium duriaei CBS 260.36]|uniref:Uncharacterized protein n=1 Tax=Myriangium duriaei CBS 260.36 TaxID=1168546 RepID=A0A9P4ITM8_9PEZI|nr:hypothetical protein K461DRAFT_68999 [Myriangium duriaei CBS 260.36]
MRTHSTSLGCFVAPSFFRSEYCGFTDGRTLISMSQLKSQRDQPELSSFAMFKQQILLLVFLLAARIYATRIEFVVKCHVGNRVIEKRHVENVRLDDSIKNIQVKVKVKSDGEYEATAQSKTIVVTNKHPLCTCEEESTSQEFRGMGIASGVDLSDYATVQLPRRDPNCKRRSQPLTV